MLDARLVQESLQRVVPPASSSASQGPLQDALTPAQLVQEADQRAVLRGSSLVRCRAGPVSSRARCPFPPTSQLSKKLHPDLRPNDAKAKEQYLNISEAYDTLGNDAKRWARWIPPHASFLRKRAHEVRLVSSRTEQRTIRPCPPQLRCPPLAPARPLPIARHPPQTLALAALPPGSIHPLDSLLDRNTRLRPARPRPGRCTPKSSGRTPTRAALGPTSPPARV